MEQQESGKRSSESEEKDLAKRTEELWKKNDLASRAMVQLIRENPHIWPESEHAWRARRAYHISAGMRGIFSQNGSRGVTSTGSGVRIDLDQMLANTPPINRSRYPHYENPDPEQAYNTAHIINCVYRAIAAQACYNSCQMYQALGNGDVEAVNKHSQIQKRELTDHKHLLTQNSSDSLVRITPLVTRAVEIAKLVYNAPPSMEHARKIMIQMEQSPMPAYASVQCSYDEVLLGLLNVLFDKMHVLARHPRPEVNVRVETKDDADKEYIAIVVEDNGQLLNLDSSTTVALLETQKRMFEKAYARRAVEGAGGYMIVGNRPIVGESRKGVELVMNMPVTPRPGSLF